MHTILSIIVYKFSYLLFFCFCFCLFFSSFSPSIWPKITQFYWPTQNWVSINNFILIVLRWTHTAAILHTVQNNANSVFLYDSVWKVYKGIRSHHHYNNSNNNFECIFIKNCACVCVSVCTCLLSLLLLLLQTNKFQF